METNAKTCTVCKKTTDAESLIFFGKEWVCAECKDDYVQCLKEGVEPTFGSGLWRQGRFVYCESHADLTQNCLSCNAVGEMTAQMKLKVLETVKFHLTGTPGMPIDVGFCKSCRNRLNRYGKLVTVCQIAFSFGIGGPMVLGWINSTALNYLFVLSLVVAFLTWLLRVFLMPEPSGTFHVKTRLTRISGTSPAFRLPLPSLPPARLQEHRD